MRYIFSSPIYLFLFIPILGAIYYRHFWKNRGGRLKVSISIWKTEKFKLRKKGYSLLIMISTLSFWGAVALVAIALAGPEKVVREKIYLNKGKDILFVLDESPSMFARDLGGSRFDAAKQQILNFIELRENDAIGLITFSSESVLRVPPTHDFKALTQTIKSLSMRDDQLGEGTDLGMALAFACYHLMGCSSDNQIVILMTDGVNNSGIISPVEAAKEAKRMGIKVYPIGIGSRNEVSSIIVDDMSGSRTQGEIEAMRNDRLLQKLAQITGGSYDSTATIAILQEVLENISSIESSNTEGRIERYRNSLVSPIVLVALFLLLLYIVIRKIWLREII